MPTYEYECQKCGHTFERFQSMTEERIKRCPECRGKVNRLFGTGAGILFKGSGFYETDYRSRNYHSDAKKDKSSSESSAEKSSSSDGTSSDSAPSANSDTSSKSTKKAAASSAAS